MTKLINDSLHMGNGTSQWNQSELNKTVSLLLTSVLILIMIVTPYQFGNEMKNQFGKFIFFIPLVEVNWLTDFKISTWEYLCFSSSLL